MSLTINPEWATAVEIARLIQIPSAMEVDSFAKQPGEYDSFSDSGKALCLQI